NGPNIFQILSEKVVGDMNLPFKWMSEYAYFNSTVKSESEEKLQQFFSQVTEDSQLERDRVSISVLSRGGLLSNSTSPERHPTPNLEEKSKYNPH
ncbi:MAG: hypothetical protein AB7F64_02780, partial [Gammaproteobacteria bacterium]